MCMKGKCPTCEKFIPGAKPCWLLGNDTLMSEPDLHQEEISDEEILKEEESEEIDHLCEIEATPVARNQVKSKEEAFGGS